MISFMIIGNALAFLIKPRTQLQKYKTEQKERQKPHLGLTWQKRPNPPGAEWSSSSCQEDRQVRGERADDALPPPASAAQPHTTS